MRESVVLITGCSSGIGAATARRFRDADWTVYATSRDTDDLAALADAGCHIDSLDVTVPDDIERVVDRIVDEQGRLDCLVNNAGFGQYGAVEDVPTERLHAQFDVNVYGPHRLLRAVLPHMRAQGRGTIVNVSSVVARIAFALGGPYCASKHALDALSEALRQELDGTGVSVVNVEPGPVDTGFVERADAETDVLKRTDAYADLYRVFDDLKTASGGGPAAIPPERVANRIVSAAERSKPPARVPVGLFARVLLATRWLPTPVRDFGVRIARRLA
jgi:NAD(P)-dependent dehydrogenase (short-subunit alcohol dehydrogenase family)